jgi:hypothetical protein
MLDFYTSYPTSAINEDFMTRWAMYAQTPMEALTREPLYEQLRTYIAGKSQIQAANNCLILFKRDLSTNTMMKFGAKTVHSLVKNHSITLIVIARTAAYCSLT